jgi:hypothetical protein
MKTILNKQQTEVVSAIVLSVIMIAAFITTIDGVDTAAPSAVAIPSPASIKTWLKQLTESLGWNELLGSFLGP